jgi:hypothetical protein
VRQGSPKVGVFAKGAARAVAASLIAGLRGGASSAVHRGAGSCSIEFGADWIGRVDIDSVSNPAGQVGILPRAFARAAAGQGGDWLQPPRPLVRALRGLGANPARCRLAGAARASRAFVRADGGARTSGSATIVRPENFYRYLGTASRKSGCVSGSRMDFPSFPATRLWLSPSMRHDFRQCSRCLFEVRHGSANFVVRS